MEEIKRFIIAINVVVMSIGMVMTLTQTGLILRRNRRIQLLTIKATLTLVVVGIIGSAIQVTGLGKKIDKTNKKCS